MKFDSCKICGEGISEYGKCKECNQISQNACQTCSVICEGEFHAYCIDIDGLSKTVPK